MDNNVAPNPTAAAPTSASVAPAPQKGGSTAVIILVIFAVILAAVAGLLTATILKTRRTEAVVFPTRYQAVLFGNGSVYYGKLEGYGTPNPVLTDVFYIVTQTNPETKQTTNVLVKRGKELHGPDRMYLNPSQIVFVEPVGPDSKVARLIVEAH